MRDDILHSILICPKHPNNDLILENTTFVCLDCGIVANKISTSPIKVDFTSDFNSGLLKNYTKEKYKHWSNWKLENLEFLLKMDLKPGLIIDLFAGPGDFHPYLNNEQILSLDFTNYSATNIITDLDNYIPLKSECADSILLMNALEHLEDTRVIKECHRLLKKDAYMYLTVPFLLDVHLSPSDYHRYTYIYLIKLLQTEKFEIDYLASSGDFGTFQTLVEHYYRFAISNGSLIAKTLWQFQKIVNYLLKYLVPVSYRLDFTGGYFIRAKKKF